MKPFTTWLLLALMQLTAQAQDFQGMAVYESKTSTSDVKSRMEGNKDITPEMRTMAENMMKKMFEKTFILNFDKAASIYKEEEKLEAPGQGNQPGMRMMSSVLGGGGTYYKNIKSKSYTVDKEFMGKEFLIKDSLTTLKWKMEGETKQIGGYNCFKATAVKPASKSDFRNLRPKDDKESSKKKDSNTNLMDQMVMPENVTVTAWYTPEIPVSQGPEGYWGLPGLILEVSDGKTTVLCSKVVLNPKDKASIKAASNGKVVSQKEYDETVVKKMEELRQMNGGRPGMMQMRMGQ